MTGPGALQHALDLAAMPGLARLMRRQPLPSDVLTVIRIAARSPESLEAAAGSTGRRPEQLREAAVAYLQQVLFTRDGNAYRVLGVGPDAPQELIGQHMRWLMKWLHPDRDRGDWESAFAERVASAWDDLKSPERRARYDSRMGGTVRPSSRRRHGPTFRRPWIAQAPQARAAGIRRYLIPALAVIAVAVLLLFPGGFLSHGWMANPTDGPSLLDHPADTDASRETSANDAEPAPPR